MYRKDTILAKRIHKKRLELMFNIISRFNPKTVLDVGCGDGTLLISIPSKFKVDIDVNTTYAKRILDKGCIFIRADVTAPPFRDESFDLIIAGEILEHITNPLSALRNLMKIVKPEHFFIVSVPNDYAWILGKILLLRFRSIVVTLREHKHHRLGPILRSFLGKPLISRSLIFNEIYL